MGISTNSPFSSYTCVIMPIDKLSDLQGKWKQVDSKNDSEMLKKFGVGKTKRRIIKRIKPRIEFVVKSDSEYVIKSKPMNREDHVVLGKAEVRNSEIGNADTVVNLVDGEIRGHYKILSSTDKRFGIKMPIGAELTSNVRLSADKKELTVSSVYQNVEQIRIFKRKHENENDEDENDAAISELEKSKDIND